MSHSKTTHEPPVSASSVELMGSALSLARNEWNGNARGLASLMEQKARDLDAYAHTIRLAVAASDMRISLVSGMGVIKEEGQEIDRLCAVLDENAKTLKTLQAVHNRMVGEQDAHGKGATTHN